MSPAMPGEGGTVRDTGVRGHPAGSAGQTNSTNSNRSTHRRQNKQVHREWRRTPAGSSSAGEWLGQKKERGVWFSEELAFTAERGETQGNTSEVGHLRKGQLSTLCVFMPEEMDGQCCSILGEAVKIKHQKLAQSHLLYKCSSDGDFKCCKRGKPHKHSLGAGKSALPLPVCALSILPGESLVHRGSARKQPEELRSQVDDVQPPACWLSITCP